MYAATSSSPTRRLSLAPTLIAGRQPSRQPAYLALCTLTLLSLFVLRPAPAHAATADHHPLAAPFQSAAQVLPEARPPALPADLTEKLIMHRWGQAGAMSFVPVRSVNAPSQPTPAPGNS